ncbi:FAD-dependent thymidylate synthase, partial [bacterium]|nr:FAD-dependent thymidylate synthase [candidate division CSSED10-310 bacterium]
ERNLDGQLTNFLTSRQPLRVGRPPLNTPAVRLIQVTPRHDELVAGAFSARLREHGIEDFLAHGENLSENWMREFYQRMFRYLRSYESVPREFELVDLVFELLVSATCYAQLKRHRMMTIVPGRYDTTLGYTIPDSIVQVGRKDMFETVMERTRRTYERISELEPRAATYLLTNAHRRRVLVKMNARQVYHFARLREDKHAQWDIRDIAGRMCAIARTLMPHITLMLCGKHVFPELRDAVYGMDKEGVE